MKFGTDVKNNMEESVSQIFYPSLSFYFISKNGKLFDIFSNFIFYIS